MDVSKLNSQNAGVCEAYIVKKFKSFKGVTYSKTRRREKCQDYYVAAGAGPHGEAIIERVYPEIFNHEMFDIHAGAERKKAALAKKPEKIMIESGQYFDDKGNEVLRLTNLLGELEREKESGAWQRGPDYFASLKTRMLKTDEGICDARQFNTEFQAQCLAEIKSNVAMSKKEAEASFDLMVGFKQNAGVIFEARSTDWGTINAKIEQALKAGLWSSGAAKAEWKKLGFSTEVEAAIAVGLLLEIEGELAWTKGAAGIKLGSKGAAFAGGRANAAVKLSVDARKGFEAAVEAGAFAGVELKITGFCAFQYDGEDVVRAAGSASVTFGAGAEFKAGIKAELFGPTTISVEGNLTVGIGAATDVSIEINFDQLALASSAGFRKVIYWRTMAQGYQATLMESDAKNLYYLNKCIARLVLEIEDTEALINSYKSTPMEKRGLLMAV